MTRQEIFDLYEVRDGIIRSPGKFEGERVWVPYFYEDAENFCVFDKQIELDILEDDREVWPELPANAERIILTEDENGFVYGEVRCS